MINNNDDQYSESADTVQRNCNDEILPSLLFGSFYDKKHHGNAMCNYFEQSILFN